MTARSHGAKTPRAPLEVAVTLSLLPSQSPAPQKTNQLTRLFDHR